MSRYSSPSLSNIMEEIDSLLAIPMGGYDSEDERQIQTPTSEEDPARDFEPLADFDTCNDDLSPGRQPNPSPRSGNDTLIDPALTHGDTLRKVFDIGEDGTDTPSPPSTPDTTSTPDAPSTPGTPSTPDTPSTPSIRLYDNWEGAALYSSMLDNLSALRPTSSSLLDLVVKITQPVGSFNYQTAGRLTSRQENSALRAPTMDTRILQGIVEVEGSLRAARNALSRRYSMASNSRKGQSVHLIRDLREKLASARTDAADLKTRHGLEQKLVGTQRFSHSSEDAPAHEPILTRIPALTKPPSPAKLPVLGSPPANANTLPSTAPPLPTAALSSTMPAASRQPTEPSDAPTPPFPPVRPVAAERGSASSVPTALDTSLSGNWRKLASHDHAKADYVVSSRRIYDHYDEKPISAIQHATQNMSETEAFSAMLQSDLSYLRQRVMQCIRPVVIVARLIVLVCRAMMRIRRILIVLMILVLSMILTTVTPSPPEAAQGTGRPLWERARARRKCILLTYTDARGVEQPGCPQTSQKRKQHASADMLQKAAAEARERARVEAENAIILATLGAPDNPHPSLPERPAARLKPPREKRDDDEDVSDFNHDTLCDSSDSPDPIDRESQARMIRERRSQLSLLRSQLDLNSRSVPRDCALVFKPVSEYSDIPGELEPQAAPNAAFTSHRAWVDLVLAQNTGLSLTGDKDVDMRYVVLIDAFKRERERLQNVLIRAWNKEMWLQFVVSQDPPAQEPVIVPPAKLHARRRSMPPFLLAALLMVAILHTLSAVAFPAAQYLLATLKVVIFGAFTMSNAARSRSSSAEAGLTPEQQSILQSMPLDLRTVLEGLEAIPDIVSYACCPKCFAIYLPDPSNPDDPVPRKCTRIKAGGTRQCRKRLVQSEDLKPKKKGDPVRTVYRPNKTYVFRKFRSWLAELLGRIGMETAVLKSWERVLDASVCSDIMDSPLIRDFVGPDGCTPFSVQTDGAVHLVFSLFVDWFNPYGNKKAGKSHSIGAIYLACLNLPPELRYRPENIYLAGIIPGPKEPNVEQLNSLLQPLVDELLTLWNPGIYLMKTALKPAGRLVRAALIPLVCDLPALRKTAGFGSYSSKHFCSFCPLTDDEKNNVERSTWPPPRSWQEHLDIAHQWKDASSSAARKEIFDEHGIRWSELLRLPYWDPTRYAVLDVMHNLFLGEIMHHCRKVWNVDVAEDKQPTAIKTQVHTPEEQQSHLDKIRKAVCEGAEKRLSKFRRDYLSAVARFNNIVGEAASALTRQELATAISTWATQNGPASLRLPPVLGEAAARFRLPCDERPIERSRYDVFSGDVLKKVRDDIAATILPSWMEKAPANFGSASHGKLKADQWRTVGTVNLVITLVRLWGTHDSSPEEREVLKNFIHLICAVDLASRRSMTAARAASYDHHMLEYLQGLRAIYNHNLVPNHHLALHLYPLLVALGPVHGWWAFPFERYNGILQRFNTNSRPADLPGTFMRAWYTGANLRWLMRTTEWPKSTEYCDMIRMYEGAFSDRVRGTRVTDILGVSRSAGEAQPTYDRTRESRLSPSVYDALLRIVNSRTRSPFQSSDATTNSTQARLPPVGQFVSAVDHDGIRFARNSRDSFITFRSSSGAILAGQISDIFYHQRVESEGVIVEPYLVVDTYKTLTADDAAHDPYRQFSDLNAWMVYDEFEAGAQVVRLQDVVAHFAKDIPQLQS
ncbi:hypothetical protein ACG7TL_006170 [Trametes sanguinea]